MVRSFQALSFKTGRIPIRGQCKLLGKHGGHTMVTGKPQNTPPPQETAPPLSSLVA
ncbi:hypothetical protein H1P_940009 [Hyella patelloides LEGE 07179]|uniref:Uncharacterized protein n=1 Tax=Hyella patelloides LEGE 07179 TaxID=945734 RepID=A0A563W588_9CYAN|nr:hypothetical protein H1P_940009 [Hyella patelloides LEGE 07179]